MKRLLRACGMTLVILLAGSPAMAQEPATSAENKAVIDAAKVVWPREMALARHAALIAYLCGEEGQDQALELIAEIQTALDNVRNRQALQVALGALFAEIERAGVIMNKNPAFDEGQKMLQCLRRQEIGQKMLKDPMFVPEWD